MLAFGTLVGAAFATLLFCLTVVSLPMLLDREVDFVTAMLTSFALVRENPRVMLGWGALIAVCLFLGMIPAFLGLFVVLALTICLLPVALALGLVLLAAAVIESILIFLVALLLVMIVPKRFYDGILIPLTAAFSTLTTLLVVYLNLTQERSILRDNFTGTLLGLAVYLLLMGLTYIVLRRNQRITAILTGLIDRLMPLALLYALFAVIGLVVVITRNVIA